MGSLIGRRRLSFLFVLAAPLAVFGLVPHLWDREASALYRGEPAAQMSLARGAVRTLRAPTEAESYGTGSARFDGEWRFATYMMSAMGFGQLAAEHPEHREALLGWMAEAIDQAKRADSRGFDAAAWGGHDPIADLGSSRPHVAYLGYLNLALSLHVLLDPSSPYRELNERITAHLLRLMEQSPIGLLETYPGEIFPIDNSSFLGSLGLYDLARGEDHRAFVEAWGARLMRDYRDPRTGLLYQIVDGEGQPGPDAVRGSGTALACYFLSFADEARSQALFSALRDRLAGGIGGFGMVREFPGEGGQGDIDSGPVVLGYGVSVTGFTLAGARMFGDEGLYRGIYGTVALFGSPTEVDGEGGEEARSFALGGPIGNGLMLALLTAQPPARWPAQRPTRRAP